MSAIELLCLRRRCVQVALIKEGAARTIAFLRAEVNRMDADCEARVAGMRKEMENLNVRVRIVPSCKLCGMHSWATNCK